MNNEVDSTLLRDRKIKEVNKKVKMIGFNLNIVMTLQMCVFVKVQGSSERICKSEMRIFLKLSKHYTIYFEEKKSFSR